MPKEGENLHFFDTIPKLNKKSNALFSDVTSASTYFKSKSEYNAAYQVDKISGSQWSNKGMGALDIASVPTETPDQIRKEALDSFFKSPYTQ